MSRGGSNTTKARRAQDISLVYAVAGGILGYLVGQSAWSGTLVNPIAQHIPYLDGLTGSLLAKYNVPWGLNPSPKISSAANALPSKACDVSSIRLAVLPEPFERGAMEPLQTTKLDPDWKELQNTPLGVDLKDCVFEVHDKRFYDLIGLDPTVKVLAKKDYPFAHEVRGFRPQKCSSKAQHPTPAPVVVLDSCTEWLHR